MKKYTFTRENIVKVLKVLAWSAASAVVATLIMIVQDTEFPASVAILVPTINTILYAVKEWLANR